MPQTLTLDEFVFLTGIDFKTRLSSKQTAEMLGLDPDKCIATVEENGYLTISQEGSNFSFSSQPKFWEKVDMSKRKKAKKPLTIRAGVPKRRRKSR